MARRSRSFALALNLIAATSLVALPAMAQQSGGQKNPNFDPNVPQPRQDKQFPVGTAWSLQSIGGKPVSGERPSLTVDDQLRGKGFGGCNTFSATMYPLREQGFAVGPVAVTRRACETGVMGTERAFLVALRNAQRNCASCAPFRASSRQVGSGWRIKLTLRD
jgi:heat shock protein HslJ